MGRANYDLPDQKIFQVMKLSGVKTKRQALIIALDEFLKRKKVESLIKAQGTLKLRWTKKLLDQYRM